MTERREPTRLGPYALGERLGRGGMGQVFRAHDARLERWVAIKQVRPDALARPGSRRRFRREARAAAALQHPSIVQIFDLLETDDGDWIVMELVEGVTLARRLADGPLDLIDGLRIAAKVAEGLSAAHARGILHRDLKSENVMLAASGGVKILDFGIAKRLPSDSTAGDDDLTAELSGELLGTLRAMSPEQSRGLPVDERSDLFSLGVLLYEVFSGVSPFHCDEPLRTLERVRVYQPVPLAERCAVPAGTSRLVDRLLEKDPARRPRDARSVAEAFVEQWSKHRAPESSETWPLALGEEPTATFAAVKPELGEPAAVPPARRWQAAAVGIALLVLAIAGVRWFSPPPPTLYVTVLEPSSGDTGDPAMPFASSLRAALVEGLLSLANVAPLTTDGLAPMPPTIPAIGRATAADELLASEFACAPELCRLELRRLSSTDGSVLWIDAFEMPPEDGHLLRTAITGRLRAAFPGYKPRDGAPDHEVDREVYERYLALHRASLDRSTPSDELLRSLAELRRRAPRWLELYQLEARVAYDRFFYTREPADLERSLRLLEDARQLRPGHPQTLRELARLAIDGGRLELAEQAVAALAEAEPGDVRHDRWRALLLEKKGRPEKALERLRRLARRRPSWRLLYDLASMEYRQGQLAAARLTLERLLVQAPYHFDASSFLAQLELQAGSPRRAVELYRQLVEKSPGEAELSNLALAHLLLGELEQAQRYFAQVVESSPRNPFFLLNLADARQLLGHGAESRRLYLRVLELLHEDPAAEGWQKESVRAQALAHLGRKRQAVAAVQRAFRLAPDSSQVAYEASLVYTLIGETTSALVQAELALQQLDRRWYSLPWFDDLRRDPRFSDLVEPD